MIAKEEVYAEIQEEIMRVLRILTENGMSYDEITHSLKCIDKNFNCDISVFSRKMDIYDIDITDKTLTNSYVLLTELYQITHELSKNNYPKTLDKPEML